MENFTTTTSDTSGQSWENIHVHYKTSQFLINTEGYVYSTNYKVDQGGEDEAMHLPVDESGISESSMLRDIIVNDLVQHGLQRPTFS